MLEEQNLNSLDESYKLMNQEKSSINNYKNGNKKFFKVFVKNIHRLNTVCNTSFHVD